jgi:hypothetical protein
MDRSEAWRHLGKDLCVRIYWISKTATGFVDLYQYDWGTWTVLLGLVTCILQT